MLEIVVYCTVAAFVGITVLGHILVFRAIFATADRISGRAERLPKGPLKRA